MIASGDPGVDTENDDPRGSIGGYILRSGQLPDLWAEAVYYTAI
jgi:hypothetical protein